MIMEISSQQRGVAFVEVVVDWGAIRSLTLVARRESIVSAMPFAHLILATIEKIPATQKAILVKCVLYLMALQIALVEELNVMVEPSATTDVALGDSVQN
jgi:tryptophan synthase beta subunit